MAGAVVNGVLPVVGRYRQYFRRFESVAVIAGNTVSVVGAGSFVVPMGQGQRLYIPRMSILVKAATPVSTLIVSGCSLIVDNLAGTLDLETLPFFGQVGVVGDSGFALAPLAEPIREDDYIAQGQRGGVTLMPRVSLANGAAGAQNVSITTSAIVYWELTSS
jgi:hypothetical protein